MSVEIKPKQISKVTMITEFSEIGMKTFNVNETKTGKGFWHLFSIENEHLKYLVDFDNKTCYQCSITEPEHLVFKTKINFFDKMVANWYDEITLFDKTYTLEQIFSKP